MTAYSEKVLTNQPSNMYGYWPMSDLAGSASIADISGKNNHGVPSDVTLEVAGIGDGPTAASFNSTTSYLDVYSPGLIADFNGAEGTFMIWAYRDDWADGAYGMMFYCSDAAYNDAVYMHKFTDNQIWLERIGNGNLKITKAPVSGSGWKHIIGVWSEAGDYLKIYIDGSQVGTPATSIGTYVDDPNQFYIGAEDSHVAGWWGGKLAHAAIWNTVLSDAEIFDKRSFDMATAIYAQREQLKDLINKSVNTQDASLDILLDAASRAIDGITNHPDGFLAITTATARYYPGSGKPFQRIDECASISSVAVKDSPTDDENAYTAWTLGTVGSTLNADVFPASGDPRYPDFTSLPYTLLVIGANASYSYFPTGEFTTRGGFRPSSGIRRSIPTVRVFARWGYNLTVPSQVRAATIAQASRWYKRFESAFADTVASAELGQLLYKQAVDPDIEAMLIKARLVRPAVGRR